MKSTIFLLATLILSTVAHAVEVQETDRQYGEFVVMQKRRKPVKVKFTMEYTTSDTCNHFGLSGNMKPVGSFEKTIRQFYVADLSVIGTEMACPPGNDRVLHLESEIMTIWPHAGRVDARVIVPMGMGLVVVSE